MSETDPTDSELSKRIAFLEEENRKLQDEVARVNRDRVEYLQNVSHQLVAPLNAIKWHIENLTKARVGVERAKKVLRSVYSQATIAVHLAKNFNLMSNLEADHALTTLKEPLQEVELCRLLVNLADDFQPLAWDQEINIVVERECFENAPPVLAMKPLISQAFSNIIENAVKYSNAKTEIVVEGEHLDDSGSVLVTVSNRGIPLPAARSDQVFERGFRSPRGEA